ncbi:BT0820 family HAD-type phosphatase [Aestuariivivens insulae]|uniref:BT0820 family HAD-type phosphatase n=1 Tax=Aestuariivivens insulae TaxID=1621988 RepID=UPI001F55E876|nr:hydrolase [Aestuariivivens insulae]
MNFNQSLIIAVDFDGTIVEDAYPKIGKPILFAFETLKKLQEKGHRLILWSYRSGKRLDEAVSFCNKHGISFYAVNKSFPEEQSIEGQSRKIHADIFIDDRNIGGFIGWGKVYQLLIDSENPLTHKPNKKRFLDFFR